MAKADKRVQIVERSGEFFAEPGTVELDGNQSLKIVNRTDEDLLWVVPNAAVFGAVVTETVLSKKLSSIKQVVNNPAAGIYEYQILMLKSGKKAKGNSDPVIIIDS
jgi:hypothetical protein